MPVKRGLRLVRACNGDFRRLEASLPRHVEKRVSRLCVADDDRIDAPAQVSLLPPLIQKLLNGGTRLGRRLQLMAFNFTISFNQKEKTDGRSILRHGAPRTDE